MTPVRVKDLRRLLPEVEELRPLRRALLRSSVPDPERTWSGSGELQTAEDRLVDLDRLYEEAGLLLEEERVHRERLNREVRRAIECRAAGDREGASRALLSAAGLEEDRERPDRAVTYASAAGVEADGLRDRRTSALALRRRARAERAQGLLAKALAHYGEAFEIGQGEGDVQGAVEAAIGSGNTLEQGGRWKEAARWYRRALDALDGAGEGPVPEEWHACLNLHIVERSLGRVEDSLPWLERAESIAVSIQDGGARFYLDHAWGQLHMARQEFQAAEARFVEALARASAGHVPTVRLNLAESLMARRLFLDAAEEARTAEADAIASDIHRVLPHVYRTLGRCASLMENPDAFVLFERALTPPGPGVINPLEGAMTLQEYALSMARFERWDEALDLINRAARDYRALGVRRFRRRWVDCFDVGSTHAEGSKLLTFFSE
jgi:tetratricopeptide (TPR) repeat protein